MQNHSNHTCLCLSCVSLWQKKANPRQWIPVESLQRPLIELVEQAAANEAESIKSNFQLELEKWNELMSFEKRAINEVGKYSKELSNTNDGLNLMESFFKKELLNMLGIEKKLDESINKNITSFQKSSVIFPTTFYQSVSKEMSGKGLLDQRPGQ